MGTKIQTNRLLAQIAGEMRPDDIPVAPGVDIEAIKAGDDDPLEVVVEVPEGKSTRGWYYTGQALQDIVKKVNANTLSGFKGHQKPENLPNEFPTPVTHWIGAVWKNGKAYFRGIVDKVDPDLKRWIRAKRIKQVSIFGVPKLRTVNGEIQVVGYDAKSIDWTPLDRAGMPTRVVAMGEMDSTLGGEMDGSHEELRRQLARAAAAKFGGDGDDAYIGVERVYDDHVIIFYEKAGTRRLYSVPYTVQGDSVFLGQGVEVEEQVRREYVLVGEQEEGRSKGDDQMTIKEKLAEIRSAIAKGEVDLPQVFGEMGVTKELGVQALLGDEYNKAKTAAEFGTKLAAALGFTPDMNAEAALILAGEMAALCKEFGLVPGADVNAAKASAAAMREVWTALGFNQNTPEQPAQLAGEMAKLYGEQVKSGHEELVNKLVSSKVYGEQAQGIIKRMLRVGEGATEEQISGEIDSLLNDPLVKGLIGNNFIDQPTGSASGSAGTSTKTGVRTRRVSV